MRQLIIARKDLNMTPGKLAAQCCHASNAFFINNLTLDFDFNGYPFEITGSKKCEMTFETTWEIYDKWITDIFTKTICEAKNLNHLLKAKKIAEELGLEEDKDFFIIKDNCLTELTPEEIDEEGIGKVITCIGFKPLDDETAWKISKKYQLYK